MVLISLRIKDNSEGGCLAGVATGNEDSEKCDILDVFNLMQI